MLVLDPQNDLTDPSGKLFPATEAVLNEFNVINNINTLTGHYRDAGATIIYSPIVFSEGYPEAGESPYGVIASVIESGAMIKGTRGVEIDAAFDKIDGVLLTQYPVLVAHYHLHSVQRESAAYSASSKHQTYNVDRD